MVLIAKYKHFILENYVLSNAFKIYQDLKNMHSFKLNPKLLTSKKSISSSMDKQEKKISS